MKIKFVFGFLVFLFFLLVSFVSCSQYLPFEYTYDTSINVDSAYSVGGSESMALSSGTFSLGFQDVFIPGRSGLDISLSRNYYSGVWDYSDSETFSGTFSGAWNIYGELERQSSVGVGWTDYSMGKVVLSNLLGVDAGRGSFIEIQGGQYEMLPTTGSGGQNFEVKGQPLWKAIKTTENGKPVFILKSNGIEYKFENWFCQQIISTGTNIQATSLINFNELVESQHNENVFVSVNNQAYCEGDLTNIQDRYGNQINVEYMPIPEIQGNHIISENGCPSNELPSEGPSNYNAFVKDNYGLIKKISDNFGNEVNFNYDLKVDDYYPVDAYIAGGVFSPYLYLVEYYVLNNIKYKNSAKKDVVLNFDIRKSCFEGFALNKCEDTGQSICEGEVKFPYAQSVASSGVLGRGAFYYLDNTQICVGGNCLPKTYFEYNYFGELEKVIYLKADESDRFNQDVAVEYKYDKVMSKAGLKPEFYDETGKVNPLSSSELRQIGFSTSLGFPDIVSRLDRKIIYDGLGNAYTTWYLYGNGQGKFYSQNNNPYADECSTWVKNQESYIEKVGESDIHNLIGSSLCADTRRTFVNCPDYEEWSSEEGAIYYRTINDNSFPFIKSCDDSFEDLRRSPYVVGKYKQVKIINPDNSYQIVDFSANNEDFKELTNKVEKSMKNRPDVFSTGDFLFLTDYVGSIFSGVSSNVKEKQIYDEKGNLIQEEKSSYDFIPRYELIKESKEFSNFMTFFMYAPLTQRISSIYSLGSVLNTCEESSDFDEFSLPRKTKVYGATNSDCTQDLNFEDTLVKKVEYKHNVDERYKEEMILDKVISEEIYNYDESILLSKKEFDYDTKGNLVEARVFNLDNNDVLTTKIKYDNFGNVLDEQPPAINNYIYHVRYDSDNRFPVKGWDDISSSEQSPLWEKTYYSNGILKSSCDKNEYCVINFYDDFDRPERIVQTGDTYDYPSSKVVYDIFNNKITSYTKKEDGKEGSVFFNPVVAFFDGFGKQIQTRVKDPFSLKTIVASTFYDSKKRIDYVSKPYLEEQGVNQYINPQWEDNSKWNANSNYYFSASQKDAFGRLIKLIPPFEK